MNKSKTNVSTRHRLQAALLAAGLAVACSLPQAWAEALDQIAVVVNKDVILQSEINQRIQVLRASDAATQKMTPQELLRAATDVLITERLQTQFANEHGIQVDDAMVNQAVEGIASQNKMDMGTFQKALQQQGINYESFREQTRRKILVDSLRKQQVAGKVNITEREVQDLISSQSAKITAGNRFRLLHLLVAAPNGATIEQVNAARTKAQELRDRIARGEDFATIAQQFSDDRAAGKGVDLGWQAAEALPVSFTRALSLMEPGDLSQVVRDQNGFHLLKLLEHEGGNSATVSEVRVRHILVSTEKYTEEVARQKIGSIYKALQEGANFAQIAKDHSDDPGSGKRGGDLGWAKQGQMVPEFERVMSSQAPNTLSQPFQTKFGWHVLEVLERKQTSQSKEDLRDKATSFLGNRKEEEQYKAWLLSLKNGAYIEYRMPGTQPGLQLK